MKQAKDGVNFFIFIYLIKEITFAAAMEGKNCTQNEMRHRMSERTKKQSAQMH